ncbi:3-oxoacyl-ACP reductase FabG [Virgibacillus senegalensis]|uniref:3-oxoacyl-ACP reductase FabG n=1 Tax=Virgibacillus senegalensis TaxID=1499679 RepID=UPI00069F9883|nr:3-oxoacyl-ACP reductase FabG [Virgibacillus senegalensis]
MTNVQWDFEGEKVFVTGGSRGIGRQIVKDLAEAKADVVFTYNKSTNEAEKVVKECHSLGGSVHSIQCDFSKKEELRSLIETLRGESIKYLINNAGILRDNLFFNMKEDEWEDVLQVNLNSLYYLTQGLIKSISLQRGAIVNVSSVSGIYGTVGQVNYSTTKAGIIGFTKSLAKEVGRLGVRVNAVAPGYIETEMIEEVQQRIDKRCIPLRRIGRVDDVSLATLFLMSDASRYITGEVIQVSGGI